MWVKSTNLVNNKEIKNLDDSFERETKADNYIEAHKRNVKDIDPEFECPICLD